MMNIYWKLRQKNIRWFQAKSAGIITIIYAHITP